MLKAAESVLARFQNNNFIFPIHSFFGGIYMMKNTLFKNLAKSMEHYGEMLNRIGY